MKVVVWGIGKTERSIEPYILETIDILAFVDNNADNWNFNICIVRGENYLDIPVISPDELQDFDYDYILIASADFKRIKEQCVNELNIALDKILQVYELDLWSIEHVKKIFDVNILADRNNFYIGNRYTWMDKNHELPKMQRELMMYDRFIPFLGAITKEKKGSYIVDIGSNIGDTVMAMWDYTDDRFLCFEPEELFFEIGEKNIKILNGEDRIDFERIFITDNIEENYRSNIYKGGTAVKEKIKENDKLEIPSESLDDILKKKQIMINEIDLIKIDTDGFDADCILSGKNVLVEGTALLYWENAIFNFEQYEKYQKAYDLFELAGYNTFFVFDNCGNFMCEADVNILRSLSQYQQRINMGWDRVTFNYIDVLGCKDIDVIRCQKSIQQYLKRYILCRKKRKE